MFGDISVEFAGRQSMQAKVVIMMVIGSRVNFIDEGTRLNMISNRNGEYDAIDTTSCHSCWKGVCCGIESRQRALFCSCLCDDGYCIGVLPTSSLSLVSETRTPVLSRLFYDRVWSLLSELVVLLRREIAVWQWERRRCR